MSAVPALCLAPDGWHLLSGGRDKVVCVWDIRNGSRVATLPVYEALEGERGLQAGLGCVLLVRSALCACCACCLLYVVVPLWLGCRHHSKQLAVSCKAKTGLRHMQGSDSLAAFGPALQCGMPFVP